MHIAMRSYFDMKKSKMQAAHSWIKNSEIQILALKAEIDQKSADSKSIRLPGKSSSDMNLALLPFLGGVVSICFKKPLIAPVFFQQKLHRSRYKPVAPGTVRIGICVKASIAADSSRSSHANVFTASA